MFFSSWRIFLLSLLVNINFNLADYNDTNSTLTPETTTSYTTSEYYTTGEPTEYGGTYAPSPHPSITPTMEPTTSPTVYETAKEGTMLAITIEVGLIGITIEKVENNIKLFIILCYESLGIADSDDNECVIVKVIEYDPNESTQDSERRRSLLQDDDVSGVIIEYRIVTSNVNEFKTIENSLNVENEDGLTDFESSYTEGVRNIDDDIIVDYDSIDIEINESQNIDIDDFLQKEKETFNELIASPYILLGLIMTIIGIIWLLFLRTNIPNQKTPSYVNINNLNQNNQSRDGDAIEMVQQTSD